MRQTIRALLLGAMIALVGAAVDAAQKKPPAAPLDLNTASAEELQLLPGVGPATAQAIIRFREKSGPFRRVEELLAISGITERRLVEIRPYVTVAPLREPGESVSSPK